MTMIDDLTTRFEMFIALGRPFNADDVTDDGRLSIDGDHAANGRQSAIGALFAQASRAGRIVPTGAMVRSTAPHRKGGGIREWQAVAGPADVQLEFAAVDEDPFAW